MPARTYSSRVLDDGQALPSPVADPACRHLERALTEGDGNKTRAAELIGLTNYRRSPTG